MKTQYITDNEGNIQSVLLSYKKYVKMLKELSELEKMRSEFGRTVSINEYTVKRKKRSNG
jgi:hypothetical protein